MEIQRPSAAVLLIALFSGCATGLTPEQKARLGDVTLDPIRVAPDAYQKPDATLNPDMATKIPRVTVGGLIPALIGSAIDSAVMSSQQRKFDQAHETSYDSLRSALAQPPVAQVEAAVRHALDQSVIFHHKCTEESKNRVDALIVSYGLARTYTPPQSEMRFDTRIVVEVTVTIAGGEVVLQQQFFGYSARAATLAEFVAHPELVDGCSKEAAQRIELLLLNAVDRKLRP